MKKPKIAAKPKTIAIVVAVVVAVAVCIGLFMHFTSGKVAAKVNGTEILEADVTSSIETIRSSYGVDDADSWGNFLAQLGMTPESVRSEMLDSFIEEVLAEQNAADKGVTVEDSEIDTYVNQMKSYYSTDSAWQSALKEAGFTEESYRKRIKQSLISEKLTEVFAEAISDDSLSTDTLDSYASMYASYYFDGAKKSSHILFSADDSETAQQVLDQINAGEISFEDAAKQYSTDTGSASDGGNVGWDVLSSFVTEYTTALSSLTEGQVSGLVTSTYGIHIIKCTAVFEVGDDETVTYDSLPTELQNTVKSMVKSYQAQTDYENWLSELRENADVVINDMPKNVSYYVDMSEYSTDSSSDSTSSSSSN